MLVLGLGCRLPFSRFDEGFRYSRGGVKTFLTYLKSGNASGAPQDVEQREQKLKSIERELLQKKREHSQMVKELRVAKREANRPERVEQIGRIKSKEQEIFRLEKQTPHREGAHGRWARRGLAARLRDHRGPKVWDDLSLPSPIQAPACRAWRIQGGTLLRSAIR